MKYLILLILCMNLFAIEYSNINYLETITGGKQSKYSDQPDDTSAKYYLSFNTYNDFVFNDSFSITSTLNFTSMAGGYSRTRQEYVNSQSYFEVSELAMNYNITPGDIVSLGIFSFKAGAFSEHTKIGMKQSDALMTLYYMNLAGIFYTRHFDDSSKLQIGYASRRYSELIPEDRYDTSRTGSDIMFVFTTNTFGRNTIKFNLSTSQLYHESLISQKPKKVGDLIVSGIGYEFDNRDDNGVLIYSILGVSSTLIDGRVLVGNKQYIDDKVSFTDEDQRIGYSYLLGAKKDFDNPLFNFDMFIGSEIFYASKYWASYVSDHSNADEYAYSDLGTSLKLYLGGNITPKCKVSIHYKHVNFDYSKKIGGNSIKEINDTDNKLYLRLDLLF